MTVDMILGTAGHIDHGKTSLIRALTGVDTDRLPEEKRRGITIELGFAELDLGEYRLGIVDVPGHERFVRNMLAGATGMDLAMLVVAADDSVKPQTREHFDILRLLDLPEGVIALTKCDLADPEWIDLVEAEIRELVQESFLADAPIVRTSATTREGLDTLRAALVSAAGRVTANKSRSLRLDGPFRMAIDRVFSMAGHGTVVTGSVSSGRASVGDQLVIQPGSIEVRIRGLQNHDRVVETVQRGQRAAVNLAGIRHDEVRRGHELASPGHLVPSRLLTAELTLLDSAPRPLKHRARVRVHVGTAELMASALLLNCQKIEPGATAFCQLYLSDEAVTTWNQPLVVRSQSPVTTVGGGRVLNPNAPRIRRADPRVVQQLRSLLSNDATERASAALYFNGVRDWDPRQLPRTAGVYDISSIHQRLLDNGDLKEIAASPRRTLRIHRLVLDELCEHIESVLAKAHAREPLRSVFDRSRITKQLEYLGDGPLIDAVLVELQTRGRIRLTDKRVGLAGQGPRMSQNEQKLLSQLIEQYRQAGFQPPTVKQCKDTATKNRDSVESLIALAEAEGELVQITSDTYIHADVEQEMRRRLAGELAGGEGLTMSQIREILGTSRKYAVPFCEYLDQIGFTRRNGDLRVLARPEQSPGDQ